MPNQKNTEYCHVGYRREKKSRVVSFDLGNALDDEIKAAYANCATELQQAGVHLSYKDFCRQLIRLGLEAHRNGDSK